MSSFLGALSVVYFIQGALLCYFTNYFKINLSQFGLDYQSISRTTSLFVIPFILKIFYGPILDYFHSRIPNLYKFLSVSIFLVLSLLCFISIVLPSDINIQRDVELVLGIVFLVSLLDVLFDSGAVLKLESAASIPILISLFRGLGLGTIALFAWKFGMSLELLFKIIFFLSLVGLVLSFKLNFTKSASKTPLRVKNIFKELSKQPWGFLLMIFLYGSFALTAESLLSLYLRDGLRLDVHSIEALIGIKTMGLLLSLTILSLIKTQSDLLSKIGIMMSTLLSLLCVLISRYPVWASSPYFYLVWGVAAASAEISFLILCFKRAKGRAPATNFLLFMTIANVGLSLSERLWSKLLVGWGFAVVFMTLASLGLLYSSIFFLRAPADLRSNRI